MGFEPITSAWKANHLPLILYSHQRVHPIKKNENPSKKSRHIKKSSLIYATSLSSQLYLTKTQDTPHP